MAQFDVFRLGDGSLVLDCQSDLIDRYDTRLVVPLIAYAPDMVMMTRLHPRFSVAGEDVVMVTQFATSVRARELRHRVGSLEQERLQIVGAIDVLIGTA
ncbi:CcdB family protein [Sphingomonas sp.]|uniref:CcdB family protein n=1 Tax=Sphingomonas sp. TaxID=28214 RepID=UPI002DD6A1AC|nr:CcdB family protein [Sphingomonas sp.]